MRSPFFLALLTLLQCAYAAPQPSISWTFETSSEVKAVAVSADGNYFTAVTSDGSVYLLASDGSMLWRSNLGEPGTDVDISGGGEFVVAAGENKFNLFDREGEALLMEGKPLGDIRGVDIASDGSMMVAGSSDHNVYSFDKQGNTIWAFDAGASVQSVSISDDGANIALGTSSGNILLLRRNGSLVWRVELGRYVGNVDFLDDEVVVRAGRGITHLLAGGEIVWTEYFAPEIVAIDANGYGRAIAVMTSDGELHVLSENGGKLWEYSLAGGNSVAISWDNSVLAAAGNNVIRISPPDLRPPAIEFLSPANGSTVSGVVSIDVRAGESLSAARALVDGNLACASLPCAWDTATTAKGLHRITVIAEDESGNVAEASIEVRTETTVPGVGIVTEKLAEAVGGAETTAEDFAPRILRKRRFVLETSPLTLVLVGMILFIGIVYLRGGGRGYHWKGRR